MAICKRPGKHRRPVKAGTAPNDPQLSENPGTRTKRDYSLAEIYPAEQKLRTGLEPKIIGFAATG